MTPGTLNLSVVAGDGYSHTLTFTDSEGTPQDQSAYTFRAQVRGATWALQGKFTVTPDVTREA